MSRLVIETKPKIMKVLKIWNDPTPMNPFTEWDCNPALAYSLNGPTITEYGNVIDAIKDAATDGKVIRHQKKIAEILGLDLYYFSDMDKYDKAIEIRDEIVEGNIEELGEICELLSIPYKMYTSRGYSQSDWADVLIVLTDDFFERSGCNKKHSTEILDSTAELFDNYAWGSVYGFSVVEMTKCKCCENESEEVIDSCGGFYGTDFENNGMMDHVPEELRKDLLKFDLSDIEY